VGELIGGLVAVCIVILGAAGIMWCAHDIGRFGEQQRWERQTVAHGCGAYTMDPATGKTTWGWKEETK